MLFLVGADGIRLIGMPPTNTALKHVTGSGCGCGFSSATGSWTIEPGRTSVPIKWGYASMVMTAPNGGNAGDARGREETQAIARSIFTDRIPFNKALGLSIESAEADRAVVRFQMREELIGNYTHGTLHGGVVSASLDVAGGLVAFMGLLRRTEDRSSEEIERRFGRLGTIDLRVDYLQPGRGRFFRASAYILRIGSRVAVTRMELHNDEGVLIATGTGAYMVA